MSVLPESLLSTTRILDTASPLTQAGSKPNRQATVTAEDTRSFLLASIALTLSATALNTLPVLGTALSLILPFVVAFVAGAMIVIALKELFQTARS